jgi:propanediol dehydratase large subunit
VHYVSAAIGFADNGVAKTLGVVPAGAVLIRGGVSVHTAFNAGTANTLNIGTSADDDGFATLLALGTIGVISTDEMATTNDQFNATADITVTATVVLSGTAATAGAGVVWMEYIVPNAAR